MNAPCLASLALLLAATALAEPFSVMSYNVRGDFDGGVATDKPTGWLSTSGEHRREAVLSLIGTADPDLLGVQEAYRNQVDEIDAALAGHAVYAVGRDDGRDAGEHCAIYYRRSRFERIDAGTFWLSERPSEPSTYPGAACPRIASWLTLRDRASGWELFVANTHWDHVSAEARAHSAELIRGRLPGLIGGRAAVVMGDLNATEDRESFQRLLGAGPDRLVDSYRSVFPNRTTRERTSHGFTGAREGSRIDYVLHTAGLKAEEAAIRFGAESGPYPSDHYPVTAVLRPIDRQDRHAGGE